MAKIWLVVVATYSRRDNKDQMIRPLVLLWKNLRGAAQRSEEIIIIRFYFNST
jgi:hypothetical protein